MDRKVLRTSLCLAISVARMHLGKEASQRDEIEHERSQNSIRIQTLNAISRGMSIKRAKCSVREMDSAMRYIILIQWNHDHAEPDQ